MKNLLKAFTLAEVLITLGIVGVVARLTLPALTQNVQQQAAEATFAKAVNTLETVNEKMKLEGASKKVSTSYVPNSDVSGVHAKDYLPALSRHLNGSYKQMNLMINGTNRNNLHTFRTKDGILFTATQNGIGVSPARSPKYYSSMDSLFVIDINGVKGPNKFGKDQFEVVIDNYGAVIPYGGAQYVEYHGGNVLWETNNGCPSRQDVKPNNPRACSGAIADNGYKILYAYNAL